MSASLRGLWRSKMLSLGASLIADIHYIQGCKSGQRVSSFPVRVSQYRFRRKIVARPQGSKLVPCTFRSENFFPSHAGSIDKMPKRRGRPIKGLSGHDKRDLDTAIHRFRSTHPEVRESRKALEWLDTFVPRVIDHWESCESARLDYIRRRLIGDSVRTRTIPVQAFNAGPEMEKILLRDASFRAPFLADALQAGSGVCLRLVTGLCPAARVDIFSLCKPGGATVDLVSDQAHWVAATLPSGASL